jgi:hypothetical protein
MQKGVGSLKGGLNAPLELSTARTEFAANLLRTEFGMTAIVGHLPSRSSESKFSNTTLRWSITDTSLLNNRYLFAWFRNEIQACDIWYCVASCLAASEAGTPSKFGWKQKWRSRAFLPSTVSGNCTNHHRVHTLTHSMWTEINSGTLNAHFAIVLGELILDDLDSRCLDRLHLETCLGFQVTK